MTIEERIKQSRFKNAHHKLAINLMNTTNKLESFLKEIFKKEEITLQQYNILRILRGSRPNPLSTLQIRERMMHKMSDTSRIVDRLLMKKLVTKKISDNDNRLVDVHITDKGLQLLQSLDDIEDKLADFMANLTDTEATTLSNLLDKITDGSAN